MTQEPYILHVTNTSPTAKSFYISQGILYNRVAPAAGQLRTGRFQAINDSPGQTSLTAETGSAVSIDQFVSYLQQNPTAMYQIQTDSTSPTAQLAQSVSIQQQGMIKNSAPTILPNRQYATQHAYHLQYQNTRAPRFFSYQDVATATVAPNSTLSLYFYPEVTVNQATDLRNDVKAAGLLNMVGEPACQPVQCIKAPCPDVCQPRLQLRISSPGADMARFKYAWPAVLVIAAMCIALWFVGANSD